MPAHKKYAFEVTMRANRLEFDHLPDHLQAALTLHSRRHEAAPYSEAAYAEANRLARQIQEWYDDDEEEEACPAPPVQEAPPPPPPPTGNEAVLAQLFEAGKLRLNADTLRRAGFDGPPRAGTYGAYQLTRPTLAIHFTLSRLS